MGVPPVKGDRRLDDGAETAVDWKDGLMGMPPHERAELYEEKGMYREALRWHRQDLSAARKRMRDGEEEDDRPAASDFARALRNTGRCLGKLDMEGFAEVSVTFGGKKMGMRVCLFLDAVCCVCASYLL